MTKYTFNLCLSIVLYLLGTLFSFLSITNEDFDFLILGFLFLIMAKLLDLEYLFKEKICKC